MTVNVNVSRERLNEVCRGTLVILGPLGDAFSCGSLRMRSACLVPSPTPRRRQAVRLRYDSPQRDFAPVCGRHSLERIDFASVA
jgi:hypothetical protein